MSSRGTFCRTHTCQPRRIHSETDVWTITALSNLVWGVPHSKQQSDAWRVHMSRTSCPFRSACSMVSQHISSCTVTAVLGAAAPWGRAPCAAGGEEVAVLVVVLGWKFSVLSKATLLLLLTRYKVAPSRK
jgi:hypothetical protein